MTRFLSPILAVSITSAAMAGPLDRAWVNPEAAWVIHLDLSGILGSRSLQDLTQVADFDMAQLEREMHIDLHDEFKIEGKDIPADVLEAWRNLDFSVTQDIKSITVFGLDASEEPDLIVLRTTDAVDEIIATLDPIEGINVAEGERMSFVALRPEGEKDAEPDQVLAIRKEALNERTVVISEKTQGLVKALELHALQSKRNAAPGPDWMSMRPGSFLMVHVSGDAIDGLTGQHGHARVLEKARELRLEAGETAGELYVDALVETEDVNIVNQVAAIANGIMAMGRMVLASEPEGQHIITLMNGIQITTQDTAVVMQFRMESRRLAETLKALEELDSQDHEEVEIHTHPNDGENF